MPIKSPVVSAVFWIASFEAGFIESVVDFLMLSRSFWLHVLLKFLLKFLAKDEKPHPFTYILSLGSWLYYLITKVKFILSSISNGHIFRELSNRLSTGLFGMNLYKTYW